MNVARSKDIPHPEELIGSRAIIQGASGAGKTYAIRRILEATHGRMQHIVFDVEDELFTLRERFDYVLIGGDDADAPISEETAGELAITLLELGVSAILQLNDFGLAGQRRIIARFLAGLMKAPRQLWHPVLVTLDEAHRYAPQSGPVESSEAIVNLATAGRKRGFGALFATQRLSQLSKDVLGQCPNRIMGRVDQALDRRVAADTLGFAPSSPEAQSLMKLSHEFWVVGPAFAPQPRRMRFSPAMTTHLSPGHDHVPTPPTPEKVRALLERLNRITPAASADEGRIMHPPSGRQPVSPDPEALRQADSHGYERGWTAGKAAGKTEAIQLYRAEIARALEALQRVHDLAPMDSSAPAPAAAVAAPKSPAPRPKSAGVPGAPPSDLSPGAIQFLVSATAHWPVLFTWGQLAALNDRKARGGYFNACRKALIDSGIVTERDGKVVPADAAFVRLKAARKAMPKTRVEMLSLWCGVLPSPAKDILNVIAAQPGAVAIEDVAARLNLQPRGGHWNAGVSMLRSNDLVRTSSTGFELGPAFTSLV